MTGEEHTTDSAEGFDPYSFAERWYREVWPVIDPIGCSRYISVLRTKGMLEGED
ncbi:hypothetical protein SEA_GIRLPOWER_55 [Streptomyces phage GirlPower]|nr:hypothetical protein SEA_GIRLPOWER_55 [Streptomyces phage GirlPower]